MVWKERVIVKAIWILECRQVLMAPREILFP